MKQSPKNTFYVTTPIYYVNGKPHIGSLYSTVLADVAARWNRMRGKDVMFVTGLDEHGQKIAQAAAQAGMSEQAFVDSFTPAFRETWKAYGCDYDHFIRTTDDYHIKAVELWLKQMIAQGDVYKSSYRGWYCTPCETFVTEKDLVNVEGAAPLCHSCERPTQMVDEECYFFRLSAYQDRLLQFYKDHPNFIVPKERAQEVISFVESGLRDLSISRSTITWGIPFPGDSKHVTYVWADALMNYVSAIGYGDASRQEEFKKFWPVDVQVMGKDIMRFHAVYWPAFLMAAGLDMPHHLLVHGWLKMGEHKISKSRGNAVDPMELLQAYGADEVRYYLTRYMVITQDSPFSVDDLEHRITSDLANDLGNLVSRVSALALKYREGTIKSVSLTPAEETLYQEACTMVDEFSVDMDALYFSRAYATLWNFVKDANAYIHKYEPWKLIKTDPGHFDRVMFALARSMAMIIELCAPIMPHKAAQMKQLCQAKFGAGDVALMLKAPWKDDVVMKAGEILFKKYEKNIGEK